jgi:hypothetical protein
VDAEDIARIEATHGPSIAWLNGSVGWKCTCGGSWPCPTYQLADDIRQQRHRVARDVRDAQRLADELTG